MSDKAFFIMGNKHAKSCGEPPFYDNGIGDCYYGYYENEHGEQWVFLHDWVSGKTELRGGDCAWGTVYNITENAIYLDGKRVAPLTALTETLWLISCQNALKLRKEAKRGS